jgi:hypothetical protein
MSTEDRLRAALDSKAATAVMSPTAYAELQQRVTRRGLTPRLQVAAAALATAAVAVGAVSIIQRDDERASRPPVAPVSSTPSTRSTPSTPSASTGVTESASASSSATSTAGAATLPGGVPKEDYVALLEDGRLVTASARTGAITAVLATLIGPRPEPGDLALSPDRRSVYFTTKPPAEDACDGLTRLDVTTGKSAELGLGNDPQISPDGRSLAFARSCHGQVEQALVVRDLATGLETTYVNDELLGASPSVEGPWYLADLVWHADSRRVWVVMDWEDAPELRLLDPATDKTLRDADDVATQHGPRSIERRGAELAYIHTCCYPESTEDAMVYLRSTSGRDREVVRSPASGRLSKLQVGPDGDLMYEQSGNLYRFDVDSGETLDLGPSSAVARDW